MHPLSPVASSAVYSKAVVLLSLIYCLIITTNVCGGVMFGPSFVSFLVVLQSSHHERES